MKLSFLLSFLFICFNINKALAQTKEEVSKRIAALAKETDPAKTELVMNNLVKEYHLDLPEYTEEHDMLFGTVALSFLAAGKEPQFEDYIEKIKNKFNQTSFMNMGFEQIFRDSTRHRYAEELAKNTVLLYNKYKDDPSARPSTFPERDWNRFMKMAAYPYYHSYAQILHASGKNLEALQFEELALKDQDIEKLGTSSAELYTELLVINENEEKSTGILRQFIAKGKATTSMIELFSKLYLKNGGSETKLKEALDSLNSKIQESYLTGLRSKMFHDAVAPGFKLTDLNGKEVSLAKLRGKVIVLDFWATWCAPCIASLPAMEKLRLKHPEVIFLFIATQEKGANPAARVKSFVQKNNYGFRVLLDKASGANPAQFEVATAYKLKGIPAKVVIDKNGKQLFLESGFSSESELMNEMQAMIKIAKEQ